MFDIARADRSVREAIATTTSPGVIVPASSANVGPGYDAVGLALDLPLLATVEPPQAARVISFGAGADELPTDETNAVWHGLLTWCERTHQSIPDVTLHVHSAIPLEGGLGSSSAALVAGLSIGRMLVGGDVDINELATELEGHPDNALPALLGGIVVKPVHSAPRRFIPRRDLVCVVVHPDERMSTTQARSALPTHIPLADAAANAARCAAVVMGIAGLAPLDPTDFEDVIHQPARFAIMPTSGACVTALVNAGIPAFLSGAGPTVAALVSTADHPDPQGAVRQVLSDIPGQLDIVSLPMNTSGTITINV
ncbi:homoserine kinase [Stomatohabitans albus]|uniref:homoserine kinase n=1 Tax=Stomatohabitans albus TaxID=3110766 RepID=UPI00300CA561